MKIKPLFLILMLLASLFIGFIPNNTVRAVWIYPGTYFGVGYTNYTVNVPINFSQIIINTTNITFNHCNFRFNQIPSTSKVNISFVSLIANPLVAASGNTIVDYYRYTAATPITMWHNITGLKPSYVYRWIVDPPAADNFVTSNVSGGIAFSTTATGTHRYTIYDYGATADMTPPAITINYAGHLNDKGSPYYIPPGETNIFHGNGYYINDSYQYEKFIYINCTITDASALASYTLRWWNVTANTWNNVTSLTARNTNYYDLNFSTGIGGSSKYSFNINAVDASGNYRNTFWNKTGELASIKRRYVHLGCTAVTLGYTPLYLYSTSYALGDYGSKDRLTKDLGTKCPPGPIGGINDLGYIKKTTLTNTVQRINNSVNIGFWYNDDSCTSPFTLNNIYLHIWWNGTGTPTTTTPYFKNWTLFFPNYVSSDNHTILSKIDSTAKSNIRYTFGGTNTHFYLGTGIMTDPVAPRAYTDNLIYTLFMGLNGDTKIISNTSFKSFIILSVPSNVTLNASYPDTDLDGLSDWTELYHTYTSPFLSDTDDDGQTDSYEDLMGSDPNNYTSMYSGGPGTLANPRQLKANWTTSSSIYLSWTKAVAINTVIVRKIGSYPTTVADGTIVYSNIGTFYNDTSKNPTIRYFYRAYSNNLTTYSSGINFILVETDNTSVTASSSALFKGWMATDKNIWTCFNFWTNATLDYVFMNETSLETSYTTGDDEYRGVYTIPSGAMKWGETYRTGTNHYYLHNITIKAYKSGNPGNIFVSLYNANTTGLPTGAPLSQGTTDANVFTSSTTGDWYNITMSTYQLNTNTMYCFMFYCSGGSTNRLLIRCDATSPTYTNGWAIYDVSLGGGSSSPTNQSSIDLMFKIWGNTDISYTTGMTTNMTIPSTTSFSISQSSLQPGQLYYYKAVANDTNGNMTKGNLRYTLTNPDVPVFLNILPSFTNNSVKITWLKGNGANRTIITKSLTHYPTTITDGTIIYNGTGTNAWNHSILFNTTNYFSLFSFTIWNGLSRFSSGVHVPWGGITFIVYNESAPWQVINASILVTDSEGLYPIQFTNVYGYYSFNISEIPYGENTLFYISNSSYQSRLYPIDIIPNIFYNFSFYLPPLHPPGWNTTPANTSASYKVQIWNQYQYPVPNALVKFYKMFNTTGVFTYIGGFVSDGNGEGSIILFPYQLYMIKITCDGFEDSTHWWEPNIVDQGLFKHFMIYPSPTSGEDVWVNLTNNIDPVNRNQYNSFTFYYNISSSDSQLIWFSGQVFRIENGTGTLTSLYLGNFSTPTGGSLSYTVPNASGRYYFKCQFKKQGFDTYKFGDINTYTYIKWGPDTSVSNLDNKLIHTLGRSPVFVITATGETVVSYIALLITFVVIVGLFTLSPRFAGFGLVLMGLLIGVLKGPLGLIPDVILNWTVAGVIIALGLILTITTKKEETSG